MWKHPCILFAAFWSYTMPIDFSGRLHKQAIKSYAILNSTQVYLFAIEAVTTSQPRSLNRRIKKGLDRSKKSKNATKCLAFWNAFSSPKSALKWELKVDFWSQLRIFSKRAEIDPYLAYDGGIFERQHLVPTLPRTSLSYRQTQRHKRFKDRLTKGKQTNSVFFVKKDISGSFVKLYRRSDFVKKFCPCCSRFLSTPDRRF